VIGGFIAALIFSGIKKIPFLTLIDLSIPSLILGQTIGRWGNFVNQEAFGNIITNPKFKFFPLAVYIDHLDQWHQATFFYESTWNLILLVIVLLLGNKKFKDGILLSTYFNGYGLGRFLIEGLRTDSLYVLPGIRVSQILSLMLIAAGIVLLVLINKGVIKIRKYSGKYLIKQ
jgi:phosphatidylglycerol:prolipoprotein diacylglycerol transferase